MTQGAAAGTVHVCNTSQLPGGCSDPQQGQTKSTAINESISKEDSPRRVPWSAAGRCGRWRRPGQGRAGPAAAAARWSRCPARWWAPCPAAGSAPCAGCAAPAPAGAARPADTHTQTHSPITNCTAQEPSWAACCTAHTKYRPAAQRTETQLGNHLPPIAPHSAFTQSGAQFPTQHPKRFLHPAFGYAWHCHSLPREEYCTTSRNHYLHYSLLYPPLQSMVL